MNRKQFDVIIVGGGMVGAAAACALAKLPLRIAVLDAGTRSDWQGGDFDLRVSAITRASQNLFESLNAWSKMQAKRVCAYHEMKVWDATGSGEIHFDCADVGESVLGHIIENSVIQSSLLEAMDELDNVEYQQNVRTKSLQVDENFAVLTLDDGSELQARLIVGADGARSWVREQLDIETVGWPYGQKGLVATVVSEHSHQRTAWQRFMPNGPLAFLPIAENTCSIVWSNTESEADRLCALDEESFLQELNEALGETPMGKVISTSRRAAFPLRLQHTKEYCKSRVVLIGDAAHAIHPLAGQGVNLGLLDAAALADVIEQAVIKRKDIGGYFILRRYERARKADNLLMMGAMDGFKRLFGNSTSSVVTLRNMGLNLANQISPLKHRFIYHAMGYERDLPPLARVSF